MQRLPGNIGTGKGGQLLGLMVTTVAYFVASHFIKRYLNEIGVPPGITRSVVIFCAALMIAYGVAFVVDWASA